MIKNNQDAVGGGLLGIMGLALAIYAYQQYAMGTIQRPGPGMFPTALGIILLAFGIAIVLMSLRGEPSKIGLAIRPAIFLFSSIVLFGALVRTAGFLPAVFVSTLVSTFASKSSWVVRLILPSAITLFSFVLFGWLLKISATMIAW